MAPTDEAVLTVFGSATCADCRRSRALLDREGVTYRYIGIDVDPDAADYVRAALGRTSTPYIVFPDGSAVTEPSDDVFRELLMRAGLLA